MLTILTVRRERGCVMSYKLRKTIVCSEGACAIAHTIHYQGNLAFCFQLCTVAHFVWFSAAFLFSYLTAGSDLANLCVMYEKKVGGGGGCDFFYFIFV